MRARRRAVAVALALFAGAAVRVTGTERARGEAVAPSAALPRLAGEIVLDGRIDEPAWMGALVVPLHYEVEPGNNVAAEVATECRIGYDDQRLYFACAAHESDPDAIRAFFAGRDLADGQDDVGLIVDTFGDARRAYLFSVTPFGVQGDSRLDQETGEWDSSWDAIWHSAGAVSEDGFAVEAAIPFRSIRFAAGEGARWRLLFFRGRPRSEFAIFNSSPLDRSNACRLCQVDSRAAPDIAPSSRDYELTPTITSRRADRAQPLGTPLVEGEIEAEAGLDLRWSPRPDLALNATWNPDFSQVEADVAQLEANTRFALFYPEKRPFFLEGGDLFETPLRAFVSRSLVDPSWGAKLTGRVGAYELAALVARDETPQLVVPSAEGSISVPLPDEATAAALRLGRRLGAGGSIGVLFTGREAGEYRHRVAGFDAFLRPHPAWTVRAQWLASDARDPLPLAAQLGRRAGSKGAAWLVETSYATREWEWGARVRSLGRGFRADSGFVPQVDVRGGELELSRLFWSDGKARWTQIGLFGSLWHDETSTGDLLSEGASAEIWIDGPLQSSFWLQPHVERHRVEGRHFELEFVRAGARLRPSGAVSLSLTATFGDAIDFAGLRAAREVRWSPHLTVRLGRRFELELAHDRQRLGAGGRTLISADLSELRSRFHFSRRLAARLVVQEEEVERAGDDPRRTERDRFSQLLVSYELHPQSAVHFGLAEGRAAAPLGSRRASGLELAERTFFFKIGWAWRP